VVRELRAPWPAVLIDADNASARIAAGLFEEIVKIMWFTENDRRDDGAPCNQ
jgi:hypothetical protein